MRIGGTRRIALAEGGHAPAAQRTKKGRSEERPNEIVEKHAYAYTCAYIVALSDGSLIHLNQVEPVPVWRVVAGMVGAEVR